MLIVCENGRGRWEAQYDALARRISKSIEGKKTEFYWDRDRIAAEVRDDGSVRLYVYADDFAFTPFLFVDYASLDTDPKDGKGYYVFADHLATPLLVEDDSGNVKWSASIDPYGTAHIESRSTLELNLRFPGHYYDTETGLHYNRFRYYSPELGRYLQSDPVGIRGGPNLYAYTANPLKRVDVLGLCPDGGPEDPPPTVKNPPATDKEETNEFEDEPTQPNIRVPRTPIPPGVPADAIEEGDIVFGLWQDREPNFIKHVEDAGGLCVTSFGNPPDPENPPPNGFYGNAADLSNAVMDMGTKNNTPMHFDLTGMDTEGALNDTGPHRNSTTSQELRNMRDTYDDMDPKPRFWDGGKEVPPPWQ
jgi:RHS repeat-associated protein